MPSPHSNPHPARDMVLARPGGLRAASRATGKAYYHLSSVLNGRAGASPAVRRAVAAYLGVTEAEAFRTDASPPAALVLPPEQIEQLAAQLAEHLRNVELRPDLQRAA